MHAPAPAPHRPPYPPIANPLRNAMAPTCNHLTTVCNTKEQRQCMLCRVCSVTQWKGSLNSASSCCNAIPARPPLHLLLRLPPLLLLPVAPLRC